tara:strand:- start:685 stop:2940 length:2256 start_codon:yes stop_codon:yes gene_type:complete
VAMFRYLGFVLVLKFFFLSSSLAQIITDLQISGNKRLSSETIKVIGNIKLEENYDEKKLNELIKKFYNSGFFKNVSVNINNNTLVINLSENPIIEDIQIEGIKKQSIVDLLLGEISLKNRKPFNEYFLTNDINLMQNILKTSGYYFAEISSSIIENDELNTVRVKISIDQGARAKIKKISFIGDKKIKDKKLLEIIASEEHRFWKFISNKVYLDQSRIALDKRLIENYYRNLGYYFVNVLSSFAEFNKDGNFNLTYNIDAGDFYYFNNLELNLPKDYSVSDFDVIQEQLKKLKGKKFSIDDFNKILTDIEKIASSRLYDFIDAKVDEQIVDNNKIDFKFNVVDSTSYYVEEINILGNYNTIEEVIRNKLIVDEGDPLNNILYNKSLDNIRSLRIFKKVEGKVTDGSDQKLKKIDIIVEEMPTGEISLAAGVGTSGSSIGGGITEKNFLGKGINLSTNLEISESSIKGQFVYSKPNFAYTDNTLHTSLTNTSTDNLSDFGYKVSELGFSVGTDFEQFQNLFFSPSISASLEDLETNSNASTKLRSQAGDYTDIYFKYGLNYDLRNSRFRPSSGNKTNFYQELPLLSDGNEIINAINFDQFKKISRDSDMIGKASFYLKAVNSIDSSDVRISKRANVPYSRLRGFEKGKIGPIDNADYIGGNYVATMNLSTNLPFILPTLENVDFSYFIDAANVWGVDYNKSLDNSDTIRTSTGIGMNILTPVGPLSFSLSKAITKENSDKTESFRFNLGTTF